MTPNNPLGFLPKNPEIFFQDETEEGTFYALFVLLTYDVTMALNFFSCLGYFQVKLVCHCQSLP